MNSVVLTRPIIHQVEKYTGLDPLSTIIKLAIIGTKPTGTKIHIHKNTINIHEPTFSQPIKRYVKHANKYDLHLLHTPIEIACNEFLWDSCESEITITRADVFGPSIRRKSLTPKQLLPGIFKGAMKGLEKLKGTYKDSPIIVVCLQYYINIISHSMNAESNTVYSQNHSQIIHKLNNRWTVHKIHQVIENYASIDAAYELDFFMKGIDTETREICRG
jgi:hypothetical protein